MLKVGKYEYDICCKNGKSHIFKNDKEIFEGTTEEVLTIFINSGAAKTGLFEYTIFQ